MKKLNLLLDFGSFPQNLGEGEFIFTSEVLSSDSFCITFSVFVVSLLETFPVSGIGITDSLVVDDAELVLWMVAAVNEVSFNHLLS